MPGGWEETYHVQETQHVLHWTVTYILLGVALVLEGFQLGRIILSDWSMVWFICFNIRQSRKLSQGWCSSYTAKLIDRVANVVGCAKKVVGGKYWQNQIPQLRVIETCFSSGSYSYPLMRKVLRFLPFKEFSMSLYVRAVTAWHREFVDAESGKSILGFVFQKDTHANLFVVKKMLLEDTEEEGVGWEHLILAMHLATAVCEKLDESKVEDWDAARWMSRYLAYVLVSCPQILAVEAENAKMLCKEVFSEICKNSENATLENFYNKFGGEEMVISGGDKWLSTLYLSAVYDKRAVHAERLTVGGEYLTKLWVLMGHTGCADESYNPTAMQRDPKFHQAK